MNPFRWLSKYLKERQNRRDMLRELDYVLHLESRDLRAAMVVMESRLAALSELPPEKHKLVTEQAILLLRKAGEWIDTQDRNYVKRLGNG